MRQRPPVFCPQSFCRRLPNKRQRLLVSLASTLKRFGVSLQHHLRIAVGEEPVAFAGEFFAQFDVVVDAAVEHPGDTRR